MKYDFKLSAFADEAASDIKCQIEAMKSNDISMLEIRNMNGKNVSALTTDEAKEIYRQLKDNGISVWSIGSPTGKIGIKDDFSSHMDTFKRTLETGSILGASCYRLFSFYGYDGSLSARDEIMERMGRFSEEAKGTSIILCHENEKDIYGEKAPECLEIHKNFPEIKAVFDPANFIQSGQNVKEAWEMLNPYVKYLHIKDAEEDGNVVPAGCGCGNLGYIINEYGKNGGNVLSLEPHLSIFEGFAELEKTNKYEEKKYTYKSQKEAFTEAAEHLKNILTRE